MKLIFIALCMMPMMVHASFSQKPKAVVPPLDFRSLQRTAQPMSRGQVQQPLWQRVGDLEEQVKILRDEMRKLRTQNVALDEALIKMTQRCAELDAVQILTTQRLMRVMAIVGAMTRNSRRLTPSLSVSSINVGRNLFGQRPDNDL
jgi:TolA-binding protein